MYLGLDLGTGSAKALLMDARGQTLAEAAAPYTIESPEPGWSETDPLSWWQAIEQIVQSLPPALRREVTAIGCSGQMHGVVLCDAEGGELRPAILWPDRRAQAEVSAYPAATESRIGNRITPGMAGPILLWLKSHETEVYGEASWALQPKDWLRLKLCGEAATDPSDATGTLLADLDGSWDSTLIAELGLRTELLPSIKRSEALAGTLNDEAARVLSLPADIPVVVGAGDTAAAILGSGLTSLVEAQLTVGTAAQIVTLRDQRPPFAPSLNVYRSAGLETMAPWYVMAAMQNAGVALEWARNLLGLSWSEAYDLAFAQAADGLIFLPYLSGERTPLMDPLARGAWIGLSTAHGRGALMRAAFHGVAFSLRAGLDALIENGMAIESLRIAGGGTLDARWRDLLLRVLQKPLTALACPNASARGAALLAGCYSEHWTAQDLAEMAPPVASLGEPVLDAELAHDYARYRDLYPRLANWFAGRSASAPH